MKNSRFNLNLNDDSILLYYYFSKMDEMKPLLENTTNLTIIIIVSVLIF